MYAHTVLFWGLQRNILVTFLAFKALEVLLIVYHIYHVKEFENRIKLCDLKPVFVVYINIKETDYCFPPFLSVMIYL